MIDLSVIRDDPDRIRAEIKKRGMKLDVDKLVELDAKRRELQQKYDERRAEQKSVKDKEAGKELKHVLKEIEGERKPVEEEFEALYLQLPNFSSDDVPEGKDESGNKSVKEVGDKPKLKDPKPHYEIPAVAPLLELERASKVAGSRFSYLKGPLALLQLALVNYAFSILIDESRLKKIAKDAKIDVSTKPFIPLLPPDMLRTELLEKMGRLDPAEDKFHFPDDGLTLAGSAEHTIGPMYADETLAEAELPIRYAGYATSFRREAGSYGKDTKGIIRRHQFDKLEMESFTLAEDSQKEQDFLVAIQEYLVASLGLPYQVVAICTGDMGSPDARQVDIECWMPGEGKYRETHTSDLMTDFQSRRLNTKVDRGGKKEFVHMNDATALAMRIIAAITENYQRDDGSVDMPKALLPYLPFKKITAQGEPA